ncbi:MAG TPA: sensor domain-containing protein [Gemmatimonadota bacterium]|nr:sensor domain-containing protein [Gemmatimonadota bacterium]
MQTSPYASFASNPVRGIFGILAWPRTYLNIAYLMIGFPIGLAYFVFYVVAGALGVGLAILGIGIVILFLLVLAAWALAHFERGLANTLLGAGVSPPPPTAVDEGGWPWVKSVLGNSVTWKGLVFQLLKFPLGLASWIVTVVVISVVGGFLAAPIVVAFGGTIQVDPWWVVNTQETAWIATLIGLVAVVPALHLLNGLAHLWGMFARLMLGRREPREPVREMWSPDPVRAPVPAL